MKSIYKRGQSPNLRYTLFHIFLILNPLHLVNACGGGEDIGESAGRHIREGMENASWRISQSLEVSTRTLTNNINSAVGRLENIAATASKELGGSIREASRNLAQVGLKLSDSVDRGVKELSGVMREGIRTAQEISDKLASTVDNAVKELGDKIEMVVRNVREVIDTLAQTIDDGIRELGRSLRYMSDRLVEIAKQVEVKINSGDLVKVSQEMKDGLIQSVTALTENWNLAINTADFKDIGKGAAEELSKALQNINVRVEVNIEVGDRLRRSIMYIAIAGGIAFSVCFVAIIISLKSCRSCIVSTWVSITNRNGESNQPQPSSRVTVEELKELDPNGAVGDYTYDDSDDEKRKPRPYSDYNQYKMEDKHVKKLP